MPKLKPTPYKPRPGYWVVSVSAKKSPTHKRQNYYFKSHNAAKEWISRFNREHDEHGKAAITGEERRWINFCRDQITDLWLLPKIIEHWKSTGPDSLVATSVGQVVDRFLEWRPSQGRWNSSTAEDTQSRLSIFKRVFLTRFIHELSAAELQEFISERGSAGTQQKYYNKLRPLFRYAKLHRCIAIDPMESIQPAAGDYHEIEIYKPAELEAMLKVAEASYPDLVPFLALVAFGFMRTEELIPRFDGDPVLQWGAFDFADGQIFVPHTVAKKARALTSNERAIPFNPTLLHWIKPYVKESGQIVTRPKRNAYPALAALRAKAKYQDGDGDELKSVRNIKNGLRHSCLTYWMAANGEESMGTVARWSGNSAAVAKKHYVTSVRRLEGKAWFGLRREEAN